MTGSFGGDTHLRNLHHNIGAYKKLAPNWTLLCSVQVSSTTRNVQTQPTTVKPHSFGHVHRCKLLVGLQVSSCVTSSKKTKQESRPTGGRIPEEITQLTMSHLCAATKRSASHNKSCCAPYWSVAAWI